MPNFIPPERADCKIRLRDGRPGVVEGNDSEVSYRRQPASRSRWHCPEDAVPQPPWRRILNLNSQETFTADYQDGALWS